MDFNIIKVAERFWVYRYSNLRRKAFNKLYNIWQEKTAG